MKTLVVAPFAEDNIEAQVRYLRPPATEMDFDNFMGTYSDASKNRFGVF